MWALVGVGLDNADAQSLSVCEDVKLVGTGNGIYRLQSNQWQRVKPATDTFIVVEANASHCAQAVAGIWGDYVNETTDSGATWQQKRSGLPDDGRYTYGVAFSHDGTRVFLATDLLGIYDIANANGTLQGAWQRRLSLDASVLRIAANHGGTAAFVWEDGLYMRNPSNGSWSRWTGPQPAADKTRGRALLLRDSGTPWVIGGSDFLLLNTGDVWAAKGPQVRTNDVIKHDDRLYAAQSGGVLRSTDQGATWQAINQGFGSSPPMARDLDVLVENNQAWLYAATTRGVWRYRLDS